MIKANARDDKGPLAILGLSGENMARLMAGEPILLDLADIGFPSQRIMIIGGRTEMTIMDQLAKQYGKIPFTCPKCQRANHPGWCNDHTDPGAQT